MPRRRQNRELARLLTEHGERLLAAGKTETLTRLAESVPAALRTTSIEQLAGEAYTAQGEHDRALECFGRAAAGRRVDPFVARVADGAGALLPRRPRRGAGDLRRGATRSAAPTQTTRCSWPGPRASTSGGERSSRHAPSRAAPCSRPRRRRTTARSPRPTRPRRWSHRSTATSWSATSISRGRLTRRSGQATSSRSSASGTTGPRTCSSKGCTRRRSRNWTTQRRRRARRLRRSPRSGADESWSRVLVPRAPEEASADYEAAISIYRQTGTREICYAIIGRGDVHRERGNLAMARAAYEEGLQLAERSGDRAGPRSRSVPTREGARRRGARFGARAGRPGRFVRLARPSVGPERRGLGGARPRRPRRAPRVGRRASAAAREQRDRFGLAESLELTALCAADPAEQALLLEEALAIWRELGNQLHEAEVELALARLSSGPAAQSAAERAERRLRTLGVRVSPGGPAGTAPVRRPSDRHRRNRRDARRLPRPPLRNADPPRGVAVEEGARPPEDPACAAAGTRRHGTT